MRLLVTGSSGFIGSSLVPKLQQQGHEVYELNRYYSGHRLQDDHHLLADVSDYQTVRNALQRTQPDVVIHLAAVSPVSYSFASQEEVLRVNINGPRNVATALVELQHGHLIYASSSEVYGQARRFPTPEDEPLHATSPYAVSKIASEEMLRVLHQTSDLALTILRPFNTFGRAKVGSRHFIVERAITQALQSHHIHLFNPRPERDFMFRDDHVAGYLRVLDHLAEVNGETFNLTTGGCWSIAEVAQMIARLTEQQQGHAVDLTWEGIVDRPLDMDRLQGDGTRAKQLLGWEAQWSLERGLDQAILEWAKVLKT